MKSLITGVGGFMGTHLVDFLSSKGEEVFGFYHGAVSHITEIKSKSKLIRCDVRNFKKVKRLISKIKPDRIYHLAAQSYPTVSWSDPWYTVQANIIGTINIYEAVKQLGLKCRILNAGSSAQYGFVNPEEVPVKESRAMKPLHPYGVTKVAQEGLAYQYYKNFGIDTFTMRIFNTTGPRKENDVCSDFTKQIASIELGLQEPKIKVGNLETKRAITDVRDEINGFYLAMEKAQPGLAYNISGSKAYKIKELLDMVLSHTNKQVELVQDPKLMRPTDEPIIFGDNSLFKEHTGWQQDIFIEQTIKDMVNYWKWKLKK